MKFSQGNAKLGTNCYIVSRPVGPTCPADCFFLDNGCYAEKTEKRFPNARKAAFNNISVTTTEIIDLLKLAEEEKCSIRLHERGDFGVENKIDKDYLKAWKKALTKYPTDIKLWAYSHFLNPAVADLQNYGIQIYASVHNEQDIKKAMKAGFSLFAYVVEDKKKKGGSLTHPKKMTLPILGDVLVCPEQRKGRNHTTCTGSSDPKTTACQYCCKGLNSIIFLTH